MRFRRLVHPVDRSLYSKTRLGLEQEVDHLTARSVLLHRFLYAFEDYGNSPNKSTRDRLMEAYNNIYKICTDPNCDCPWKDKAWIVNEIKL